MLSVVCPVYNEAAHVPPLLTNLAAAAGPLIGELILAYDRDDDDTLPAVKAVEHQVEFPIRLVKNHYQPGPCGAIRSGFDEARFGGVLVIMADLADDLGAIPRMVEAMRQGADIVCGSRYMRGGSQQGGPRLKGTLSRLAGLSLHWVAGLPVHDVTNSFKLYRRDFLRQASIESQAGFEIGIELVVKAYQAGARLAEVPCTWTDRTQGTSRFRLFRWLPVYLRWYWLGLSVPVRRLASSRH